MKLICQKCGNYNNILSIECGDIFLGYLCTQCNLKYTKILTKLQEEYFQRSIDEFKKFVEK